MKILRLVFVALLLIGMLGDSNASFAVNGIILKEEVSPDSYCHLKFPVIREGTLARIVRFLVSKQPVK